MDVISLFSALSLVAVLIYVYVGISTYRLGNGSNIHKAFLALCLSYAIWSFAYSFAYVSEDEYVFSIWNKISAVGWCSFSSISLLLVLLITEKRILEKKILKFLIFLPAFVFLFMAVFLFGVGINTPPIISSIFYIGDFIYNFAFLFSSIGILFIWGLKADNVRQKKQSNILVLSSVIPFLLNLLTQSILPVFGINNIPLMGQLYSVIMIIGTYIVITKYKFLRLPEKFILDEVSKEILDMVMIADKTGRILQTSRHALDSLGFEEDELLKKNIEDIIDGEGEKFSINIIKESDTKFNNIYLLKKNGGKIPVNISAKRIFDSKVHDFLGVLLIIQDISMFYELQKKNDELKESEKNIRSIIDNNPMSIQIIDREGITKMVNTAFTRLFGAVPPDDYSFFNNIQKEREGFEELVVKAKNGEVVYFPDFHFNAHNVRPEFPNMPVWIRMIIFPVHKNGVMPEEYVVMHEDVSERKRMEKEIYNEKERLKTTLLSVCEGVISTDRYGTVELLNRAAEQFTGWRQNDAIGKPIEEVYRIINEHTEEQCENPISNVLKTKNIMEIDSSKILISKNDYRRPVEDSAAPIMDESGNIEGAVLVFRDFTERKERQTQIEYLSYHDQLTGLYNRRFFEEELKRLDVERNLPLTVVMGDVNGLKLLNDSFGHATGDNYLRKVAEVIKKGCRTDDIVARLGGDEFIILLPRTDAGEAEIITKRIRTMALNERVGNIDISVSFGYESKVSRHVDIKEILKKAEDQMYKKKLFESPSMRGRTIQTIISTLHEKNKREEQHSHRVSELCKSMAEALALNESEIEELKSVGLLHDIGKIAIDENILNKPGKLTDDERKEIMRHPEIGYRILSTVNDMAEMANYVLAHHERWDGTGYPKHLKGREIPLQSRIIAIADAFDAMTSERSYRNALSNRTAIEELYKKSGTQFDPELVTVFIRKVLSPAIKI